MSFIKKRPVLGQEGGLRELRALGQLGAGAGSEDRLRLEHCLLPQKPHFRLFLPLFLLPLSGFTVLASLFLLP